MGLANIAATNMEHLCNDDSHGYSQQERWGDKSKGVCTVECEGHVSVFHVGDRDCSSGCIDSWSEALTGTPFEGCLNGATYTGNIKSVFLASGLFEEWPVNAQPSRGDLLLNEVNHVAMYLGNGLLGEFSISETGDITGQSGDQTTHEAYIHGVYSFPWDCIIHYNGKADGTQVEPAPAQQPKKEEATTDTAQRKLRVYTGGKWLAWSYAGGCEDDSGDDYAGIAGSPIYGIETINCGKCWVERADGTTDDGQPKDSPITGLHLTDADYQAHWIGASSWGKIEHNDDDDGAGCDRTKPLDMIRLLN